MTKRQMEQQANRTINSEGSHEMSEKHIEVLRSYGFQFGKKTGSRFIAAVHEIVGIVSADKITEMQGTILALQFDVNHINDRLVKAQEDKDNLAKKLAVIETDFLNAVKENGELKVAAEDQAKKLAVVEEDLIKAVMAKAEYEKKATTEKASNAADDAEPITMSMCANKADYEEKVAAEQPAMTEAETINEASNRG